MNNSNYTQKANYNYCKPNEPSSLKRSAPDSIRAKEAYHPIHPVNSLASPNTKAPASFVYPKHSEKSVPSSPTKEPITAPSAIIASKSAEVTGASKETATATPPPKSELSKSVCDDQWWLGYDAYLKKIL